MAADPIYPGQFDYWYDTPYRKNKINKVIELLNINFDPKKTLGDVELDGAKIICIDLNYKRYGSRFPIAFGVALTLYKRQGRTKKHVNCPSIKKIIGELVAHRLNG